MSSKTTQPFDNNDSQTFSIELKTNSEKKVAIISTMGTRHRKKEKSAPKILLDLVQ